MSWRRGVLAVLAVCVLLLTGSAGCGSSGTREQENGKNGSPPSPVGELLDERDKEGHRYREVDEQGAPDVGIEVQPAADGAWDVRLTVRHFRFSPAGTPARAVAGQGFARLYVNGRPVVVLRAPEYRLPARYVPHGTHHLTARLYADDSTVWAVDGKPVESTADITASAPDPGASGSDALSAPAPVSRTGGRGSPDDHGEAS